MLRDRTAITFVQRLEPKVVWQRLTVANLKPGAAAFRNRHHGSRSICASTPHAAGPAPLGRRGGHTTGRLVTNDSGPARG
jgi:hypothetical protein